VSGGADNDSLGIDAGSAFNTLDRGDGADFVGATGESNWLIGAVGNDIIRATGASNALLGGDGDDQLSAI
jgi:Ca2+-binding RTX toxin-like protein